MVSWQEARCRGEQSVLSHELTPLLELEWWLEGAFTWTVTKFRGKVNLEFVPRHLAISGYKRARFHDRLGRVGTWKAQWMSQRCVYILEIPFENKAVWTARPGVNGGDYVRHRQVAVVEPERARSESVTSLLWLTQHNQTIHSAYYLVLHHFHHLRHPGDKCLFPIANFKEQRILRDNREEHELFESSPTVFASLSLATPMRERQLSSSEFAIQQNSRKCSIVTVMRYSMF